jgi:hypothetical protein
LIEATTKPGPCQVGINAEDPCPRRAEVEILGVAFCGPCARKQEVYFAIGELTQQEEALKRMLRGRTGSTKGIASAMHDGLSGVDESVPLAIMKS